MLDSSNEIKKSTWVSNPVLVPKKNTDVLCVCVDYTVLNKNCPKDPFPLDQIINSSMGCKRISFLDAYFGYNHIKLKEEDKKKTFIPPMAFTTTRSCPLALKTRVPSISV
jgi:hypothetical protein